MFENPVLEQIESKQKEITEISKLRRKKKTINSFALTTSFLLLLGVTLGVYRILVRVLN